MNIEKIMEMLKMDRKKEKVEDVFERAIKDAKGAAKGFSAFILVTDKQNVVYGTGGEVLAMLAEVINSLGENGMPKEVVQHVIDVAYMDEETLKEEAEKSEKKAKESCEKLEKLLNLLGDGEDEEDEDDDE